MILNRHSWEPEVGVIIVVLLYRFSYFFIHQNVTYNIHSKFHNATGRTDWRMYRTYRQRN